MNAKISPKMITNMKYGIDSTSNEFIQGYCYDIPEDLSSNLTTANHSPFMLSSHQSFSSATTASTNTTLPLWNDVIDGDGNRQVVGRCQNCSYKFYIRGGSKSGFCSRDCETCFVLFNKNGNSFKKVKSVEEIRKSIFDFQNEVDRQQPQQILEQSNQLNEQYPLHIPSVFPQVGERTDRPPLTVERIPGLVTIDEQIEEKEKTRWALNPAAALFSFGNKLSTPRRKVKTVAVE